MVSISASEARRRLFPLLEQVNTDHEPVRITSKAGDAVLMSADDYDSWQETVYLLRSPENARRLMEAVARDKANRPAPGEHKKRSTNSRRWPAARSEKHQLRSRCVGGLSILVGLRPQDGPTDHQIIGEIQRTRSPESENQNRSRGNCPGIGLGGSTTNIGSCTAQTTTKSRSSKPDTTTDCR